MHYIFEWDNQKAQTNLRKHNEVSFERAATVFIDPNMLVLYDAERSIDEDRWITVGIDRRGILLTVCHTYKVESETSVLIRIYSARKATAKENKNYREL